MSEQFLSAGEAFGGGSVGNQVAGVIGKVALLAQGVEHNNLGLWQSDT